MTLHGHIQHGDIHVRHTSRVRVLMIILLGQPHLGAQLLVLLLQPLFGLLARVAAWVTKKVLFFNFEFKFKFNT